jgi:hypothetical protein
MNTVFIRVYVKARVTCVPHNTQSKNILCMTHMHTYKASALQGSHAYRMTHSPRAFTAVSRSAQEHKPNSVLLSTWLTAAGGRAGTSASTNQLTALVLADDLMR